MIGYLLLALIACLGLVSNERSIFGKLITVITFLFMWVLISFAVESPDYAQYEYLYFNLRFLPGYEPAYAFLCNACIFLGLGYEQFRMVVAALVVLLSYATIRMLSSEPKFALSLFLLFPFLGYASALRQALSSTIICLAIAFLLRGGNHAKLKYLALVFLAAMFHYEAFFFVLLVLARKDVSQRVPVLVSLVFFVAPLAYMAFTTGALYSLLDTIGATDKVSAWFDHSRYRYTTSITGFLAVIVFQTAMIALLEYGLAAIKKQNIEKDASAFSIERYQLLLNANYLVLFALPLCAIDLAFLRLLQAPMLVNYALMANVIVGLRKETFSPKPKGLTAPVVLLVGWCALALFFCLDEAIVVPVLTGNPFLIQVF